MTKERTDEELCAALRQYGNAHYLSQVNAPCIAADRIEELVVERSKLQCENADLQTVLMAMVSQHCFVGDSVDYDSAACSANAEAMRFLADCGRLEIVKEAGGRILANEVQCDSE